MRWLGLRAGSGGRLGLRACSVRALGGVVRRGVSLFRVHRGGSEKNVRKHYRREETVATAKSQSGGHANLLSARGDTASSADARSARRIPLSARDCEAPYGDVMFDFEMASPRCARDHPNSKWQSTASSVTRSHTRNAFRNRAAPSRRIDRECRMHRGERGSSRSRHGTPQPIVRSREDHAKISVFFLFPNRPSQPAAAAHPTAAARSAHRSITTAGVAIVPRHGRPTATSGDDGKQPFLNSRSGRKHRSSSLVVSSSIMNSSLLLPELDNEPLLTNPEPDSR